MRSSTLPTRTIFVCCSRPDAELQPRLELVPMTLAMSYG
jgi:hypothetical protein